MTIMVFRAPGPNKIHGHMVEYVVLPEGEQVEQHLAGGWHMTAIEAGEAKLAADRAAAEQKEAEADDTAAATREEAVQKLEELGITFDRRLGTKKLLALLELTLKDRAAAAQD